MYCENVSANPDSGRAITHRRVFSQNGRLLVTMSRIVPRGRTAYASVKTARSVVSSVWAGMTAGRGVVAGASWRAPPRVRSRPLRLRVDVDPPAAQPGAADDAGERALRAYGVTAFLWCSCAASTTNASSGAKTAKSASYPISIRPLRRSPVCAGRAPGTSSRHTSTRSKPRCRASVQTADSPSWSEEMPPQATPKSPMSRRLQVERRRRVVGDDHVDGAVAQALPQQLAVAALADRRAALELGRAVGDLLGGEGQVVRAGLGGDPDAVAAWRTRSSAARRSWRRAGCAPGSRSSGPAR